MPKTYLYGGLSNVEIEEGKVDLGHGVFLRPTYAHLMSTNIVAFDRPPPGKPHPPPWRAAGGGYGYDIEVELAVPNETELPGGLSAEDAIWWIAALIRLMGFPFLSVPIIADRPFSEAARSEDQPVLHPFETDQRLFEPGGPDVKKLELDDINWLRSKWETGACLMQSDRRLEAAIRACDAAIVHGRTSSSLMAVWGGLEQLFAPSSGELRYRVSCNIASFLEPPGAARLDLYQLILGLYKERSKAAHTANEIEKGPLVQSFVILRNALIKIIGANRVPTNAELEELLFCAGGSNSKEDVSKA